MIDPFNNERKYIICPQGLKVGDKIISGENVEIKIGNWVANDKNKNNRAARRMDRQAWRDEVTDYQDAWYT